MVYRFVAVVFLASGCTHVTRDGIVKRDEPSARLRSDGISVDKVDGQTAIRESGSAFLSPGTHSLVLSLDDRHPVTPRFRERRLSTRPLALCFATSAGHSYVVKPTYHGWQWQADLFDEVLGLPVEVQAADPTRGDCEAPVEEVTPEAIAEASSALVATPNPRSRSSDYETDRDYVDPHLAGTGLALEAGMLLGGDNLGSGMSVSLGAQWTPLWVGDKLGIGLGGSFGYKGNSFHTYERSVASSRYPWVVAAHGLFSVTDGWLLLLRGGIQSDSGLSATVAGTTGQLHSLLGFLGEAGAYLPFSRHLAGSVVFRYSNLRYSSDNADHSANSFGPLCTLHIVL